MNMYRKRGLFLFLALSLMLTAFGLSARASLREGKAGSLSTVLGKDSGDAEEDGWPPIGSVVLLNGGTKTLMIIGRVVQNASDEKIYEYCGCLYPEGYAGSQMYFFNQEDISIIACRGYENEYEMLYREETLSGIDVDALTVKDGQIVQRASAETEADAP